MPKKPSPRRLSPPSSKPSVRRRPNHPASIAFPREREIMQSERRKLREERDARIAALGPRGRKMLREAQRIADEILLDGGIKLPAEHLIAFNTRAKEKGIPQDIYIWVRQKAFGR